MNVAELTRLLESWAPGSDLEGLEPFVSKLSSLAASNTSAAIRLCQLLAQLPEETDGALRGIAARQCMLLLQAAMSKEDLRQVLQLLLAFTQLHEYDGTFNPANIRALCMSGALAALLQSVVQYEAAFDFLMEPNGMLEFLRFIARDYVQGRQMLRDLGIIPVLVRLLLKYASTDTSACSLLMNLSKSPALHGSLRAARVVDAMCSVLQQSSQKAQQYFALVTVAHLCGDNSKDPVDQQAMQLLLDNDFTLLLVSILAASCSKESEGCMTFDQDTWFDLQTCCQALQSLTRSRENCARLLDKGVVGMLAEALGNEHGQEPQTCGFICGALLNCASFPELRHFLRDSAACISSLQACSANANAKISDAARSCLLQLGLLVDATAQGAMQVSESQSAAVAAPGGASSCTAATYDVFLSHKRTDAKDFARALYNLLVLRGFSTFLDFEYREELILSELGDVVHSCGNLIFVLTDNIFDSQWCILELLSAVKHHVNIILITKDGARWPDESGNMTCKFPPTHLIKTLPVEVQKVFAKKSIVHSDEYYQAFVDTLLDTIKGHGAALARSTATSRTPSVMFPLDQQAQQDAVPSALLSEPVLRRTNPLPVVQRSSGSLSQESCALQSAALWQYNSAVPPGRLPQSLEIQELQASIDSMKRGVLAGIHDLSAGTSLDVSMLNKRFDRTTAAIEEQLHALRKAVMELQLSIECARSSAEAKQAEQLQQVKRELLEELRHELHLQSQGIQHELMHNTTTRLSEASPKSSTFHPPPSIWRLDQDGARAAHRHAGPWRSAAVAFNACGQPGGGLGPGPGPGRQALPSLDIKLAPGRGASDRGTSHS